MEKKILFTGVAPGEAGCRVLIPGGVERAHLISCKTAAEGLRRLIRQDRSRGAVYED